MNVTVSVITAVYNDERYIRQSVESVMSQTFTDFEHIIVDDGSTDRTLQILQELAQKDKRIIVLQQQNKGAAAARNLAISTARGRYIAIQDSDDLSAPRRLQEQVKQLDSGAGKLMSTTGYFIIDEAGAVITTSNKIYRDINQNILNGTFSACHPSMMLPREPVVELGGYDPFYQKSEDFDLVIRLIEAGVRVEKLNQPLYHYRLRGNSEGSLNNGAYTQRVYENHLKRINSQPHDFSTVNNIEIPEKNHMVKRYAREYFFSENYGGYIRFYAKSFYKLPFPKYPIYFAYSLLPSFIKKRLRKMIG